MLRHSLLLLILSTWLAPTPGQAESATEREAKRQLEFARQEVGEKNFEKALTSAESALRLHPALYDAFVFKALAFEGLGDLKTAESFLVAYKDLTPEEKQLSELPDALQRVARAQASAGPQPAQGDRSAVARGVAGLEADDLPPLPAGSEEFARWLIIDHRRQVLTARRDIGGALLAGGAGLAGLGGGLVGAMVAASQTSPDDPNIENGHAAGLGALASGGVLLAVALPLTVASAVQLAALEKEASGATAARKPRVEIHATGLALRFP